VSYIKFGIKAASNADTATIELKDLKVSDEELGAIEIPSSNSPENWMGVYCGSMENSRDWGFFQNVKSQLPTYGINSVSWNMKWSDVDNGSTYDYSDFDNKIQEMVDEGFDVYIRLSHTPAAYQAFPDEAMPPDDYGEIESFCENFATHYRGVVSGVDNFYLEPNFDSFFTPTTGMTRTECYAAVQPYAYDGIKSGDPNMKFSGWNPAGVYSDTPLEDTWSIQSFISETIKEGIGSSADYLGVHNYPGYPSARPPEWIFEWASDATPWSVVDSSLRAAYNNLGIYDFSVTELGLLVDGTETYPMDESKQSNWTARNIIYALARGCQLYHIMFLRDITIAGGDTEDNRKGIFNDDYSPRDVLVKIGIINNLLGSDVNYIGEQDIGDYAHCHEFRVGGNAVIAAWCQDGEIYHSSVPADVVSMGSKFVTIDVNSDSVTVISDSGSVDYATNGRTIYLELENSPIFITYPDTSNGDFDYSDVVYLNSISYMANLVRKIPATQEVLTVKVSDGTTTYSRSFQRESTPTKYRDNIYIGSSGGLGEEAGGYIENLVLNPTHTVMTEGEDYLSDPDEYISKSTNREQCSLIFPLRPSWKPQPEQA
jgi:hypothetical protein